MRFDELRLAEPVRSVHRISHDPTPEAARRHGRRAQAHRARRAAGVLREGLQARRGHARRRRRRRHGRGARRSGARCSTTSPATRSPPRDRLDWTAKLRLLEGYRERDGLTGTRRGCTWSTSSTPTCAWRRASTTGWPPAARSSGWSRRSRSPPRCPPRPRTRAPTSAAAASSSYPSEVAAASWDSVIFDLGRESLLRIPTLEPAARHQAPRRRADRQLRDRRGAVRGPHPRLTA